MGCVAEAADLLRVIETASQHGAVVLLDEAHLHFHVDHWTNRVNDFDNLVVARTFSKACGLAGLRFGYLLTNPILRRMIDKARPVVEINAVAGAAALYLLDHPEVVVHAVNACK